MNAAGQLSDLNKANRLAPLHCVWMDAGVVDFKLCDLEYDCEHCPFDEALHNHPLYSQPKRVQVRACELAPDLFYDRAHSWARVEADGMVRIGLDDFGQRLLGPAYCLTLPALNTRVKRAQESWSFSHQFGTTSIPSPVAGRVQQTNSRLFAQPALVNRDPYGEGWAMLVEPTDLKTCLKRLMYGEKAGRWLAEESERLRLAINDKTHDKQNAPLTMTDGGLLTREFLNGLTVEQTRQIIISFFPFSSFEEAESKPAIIIPDGR